MGKSETRWVFWDGVPNVGRDGALAAGVDCKFALSDKVEVYEQKKKPAPATLVLGGSGPTRVVVSPPMRVRIKEVDESFVPVEQLLGIKLRLHPVRPEASLLLRVYRADRVIYQEIFTGEEMQKMQTADVRGQLDGKTIPRKNLKADVSRRKLAGAQPPGGPCTVRAWIAAWKGAFKDCTPATTIPDLESRADVVGDRHANEAVDQQAEAQRVFAKYGDKPGRNQSTAKVTGYTKAQFVAFNIQPGTKEQAGKTLYLGDADTDKDISKRCAIMRAAIRTAAAHGSIRGEADTLKIFMAPEFFFRGTEGGYPVEKLSDITGELRKETSKADYKDWLFIFGTAIGYLKHENEGKPIEHQVNVASVREPKIGEQDAYTVLYIDRPDRVKFENPEVCARALIDVWKVVQDPVSVPIENVWKTDRGYQLGVARGTAIRTGACKIVEPIATEVFNVAFVQRGGGTSDPLIVYKENVSSIDFLGPYHGKAEFDAPDGSKHIIEIHGKRRTVLPTEGAVDTLGSRNVVNQSEVNLTGIGGGSVFTIDGITFGLEVCLDHGQRKLASYYEGSRKAGDPLVQVQLIPSWGMDIKENAIACVDGGLVFNVDGPRIDSEALVNDGLGTAAMWKPWSLSKTDREAKAIVERVGPHSPIARLGQATEVKLTGMDWASITQSKYFLAQYEERAWTADPNLDHLVQKERKGQIVVYESKDLPAAGTVR